MDKDRLASILDRDGRIKPVHRQKVDGEEVFIADGFIDPPHDHLLRFGVKPDEYPRGCFMTLWWTSQRPARGGAAFFKPDHDPLLMDSYKQKARINSVVKAATYDIRKMKNAYH